MDQGLDHYIFLDFEATCEVDRKIKPQEIIEFPSVVLDAKTLETVDQIQLYVRPIKNPILSEFCTSLTGINQSMVQDADIFRYAFKKYDKWVQKYPTSVFITCGDWDLKTALPAQAKVSKVDVHRYYRSWVNIKTEFSRYYKTKARGMTGMLDFLKMDLIGRHHSGLDDCVNTARIWKRMLKDGYVFSWECLHWT